MILSIETATNLCSVALHQQGQCVAYAELDIEKSHASRLTLLIEQIMENAGVSSGNLQAVAISGGPGSYTGLRIGTATAKGFCFSLDIPLLAVDSLQAMAAEVSPYFNGRFWLAPLMDARRMEVYTAIYDHNLQPQLAPQPLVLTEEAFGEWLQTKKVVFFGNGAPKARHIIGHEQAIFLSVADRPNARQVGRLAYQLFELQQFADLAYFEPYYLKEFQGAIVNKSLR